jgi:hypothetical protein
MAAPPELQREAKRVRELPGVAQTGLTKTLAGEWALKVWLEHHPLPEIKQIVRNYPVVYEAEPLGVHGVAPDGLPTEDRGGSRSWVERLRTLSWLGVAFFVAVMVGTWNKDPTARRTDRSPHQLYAPDELVRAKDSVCLDPNVVDARVFPTPEEGWTLKVWLKRHPVVVIEEMEVRHPVVYEVGRSIADIDRQPSERELRAELVVKVLRAVSWLGLVFFFVMMAASDFDQPLRRIATLIGLRRRA